MVDFIQFQQRIKDRLAGDRSVRSVEAEGPTLEEAVAQAATLLDIPVRRLEYEIIERGSTGFFGMRTKNWKIHAYERVFIKDEEAVEEDAGETVEGEGDGIGDRDGEVFVQLTREGVFLKVTAAVANGKQVSESDALDALAYRAVTNFNHEAVIKAVKAAAGEYILVGEFIHNPIGDASMSVSIEDQEMKAYIKVTPAGPGGCDITAEMYLSFLRNNRIVAGVDEDFLRNFADRPTYNQQVLIAVGDATHNGKDAYIKYNFETDQTKVRLVESSDGRIDFKELNVIQNVVTGQPLAKKIPAERGVNGKTVTGRVIPATDGKDTALPIGKNVHVGDDEETILSDTNGQVIMAGDKINVEPIFNVQGNVNLKTGNIIFLGTVCVSGNVEDGFSIKAAGNIEVKGTVERAELDAEGDIIVHQGIAGKGTGVVKAGRSLWAKFIENTNVEVGNMVVVSDGIINSNVNADKRIVCRGKRATIVGGRLRAAEEINAKVIGNPTSGTETICEVGLDPKVKEELDKLAMNRAAAEQEIGEVQFALQNLVNIKKQRKVLPEDKELELQELSNRRQDLIIEIQNVNSEILRYQDFLNDLKVRGKVSASEKVYPGVKIFIKDAREDVRSEYKAVTFILENDLVRAVKYEEPVDLEKPPVED